MAPYTGTRRRLVLAFDVGTTFSAVAYCVLDPGIEPQIQAINRYPGQENGDCKIPTILYYTQEGKIRAAGAEAMTNTMRLMEEDEDLISVEWFKLHLRPIPLKDTRPRPLPPGKNFLGYLYECARRFVTESHPNGENFWDSLRDSTEIILTHPNGWEGLQQDKMRGAALSISDITLGHARVSFVTEGEASLHYCLQSAAVRDAIQTGNNIMIIDAGGGTIDISTYTFTNATAPITVEEIAPPGCIIEGSTRVTLRAQEFLLAKLRDSRYGNEEDMASMLENFDRSTKITFRYPSDRSYIKFGSTKDKDLSVGIRSGQLVVDGADMAQFFEPSISAILEAVAEQVKAGKDYDIKTAFLVGGFAASPYLYNRLRESLRPKGISLSRPDTPTNKAVAEGAVSYFLHHLVCVRVAPVTYGTRIVAYYDPLKKDHLLRKHHALVRSSGQLVLPNAYLVSLAKGTRMQEGTELCLDLHRVSPQYQDLDYITAELIAYRGESKNPCWIDEEPDMFSILCTVEADTSKVVKTKAKGAHGPYYRVSFKLILICGMTEMSAQIGWSHNNHEFRGPAKIVYHDY
ncbi:hypothetical protein C8Q75DRAFT_794294 [Abortiporus biennis]|nr:hypothetical protein C8Q75DRAFT_794294 [Abortiporus biennis]